MANSERPVWKQWADTYHRALRAIVLGSAAIAGFSVMVMVGVTTVDIILRVLRMPVAGAYDIVRIAGLVAIAAALPYTTATKGHVAIEYFFHKLGPAGRLAVDTLMRALTVALFGLLAWQCAAYGNSLRQSGEVSMTLQLPIFWAPYLLGLSCVLVALVTLYHLYCPGKEMFKP